MSGIQVQGSFCKRFLMNSGFSAKKKPLIRENKASQQIGFGECKANDVREGPGTDRKAERVASFKISSRSSLRPTPRFRRPRQEAALKRSSCSSKGSRENGKPPGRRSSARESCRQDTGLP